MSEPENFDPNFRTWDHEPEPAEVSPKKIVTPSQEYVPNELETMRLLKSHFKKAEELSAEKSDAEYKAEELSRQLTSIKQKFDAVMADLSEDPDTVTAGDLVRAFKLVLDADYLSTDHLLITRNSAFQTLFAL